MNDEIICLLKNYFTILGVNIDAIKSQKIRSKKDKNVLELLLSERIRVSHYLEAHDIPICSK